LNRGAGRLRTPILIRRATEVQNAKGGYDTTWATIASCRADVEGLDGREVMLAQALQGVSSYRITIRWCSGIKARDQVQLPDGTELNIAGPPADPDGRRRWLTILADTGSVRAETP
jgi:SPP1 family predicted phage head-tail adaptor